MEQYEQNLKEAARHLQIADHMTYVTFPLINDHCKPNIIPSVQLSIANA